MTENGHDAVKESALEILAGWGDVTVTLSGPEYVIAGRDPYGVARAGHRVDPIGLAYDLAAIAEREYNPLTLDIAQEANQPGSVASASPESPPDSPPQAATEESPAPLFDGAASASPAYAGTALSEDAISRMRTELMLAVDEHATALEARIDPVRQAYLTNGRMLGVLKMEETAELDRIETFGSQVRAHASGLKAEIAESDPDFLEIFDVGEGWPDPPT